MAIPLHPSTSIATWSWPILCPITLRCRGPGPPLAAPTWTSMTTASHRTPCCRHRLPLRRAWLLWTRSCRVGAFGGLASPASASRSDGRGGWSPTACPACTAGRTALGPPFVRLRSVYKAFCEEVRDPCSSQPQIWALSALCPSMHHPQQEPWPPQGETGGGKAAQTQSWTPQVGVRL